jgi:hypothetical protein
MAFRGIDIRETGDRIIVRTLFQDSDGALVTSGTPALKLYEQQSDGSLYSYDFNDSTFKSGALTTESGSLVHRQGNNDTTNTGIWTTAITTLTDFTAGSIYYALASHASASPTDQVREFQFGSGVLADMKLINGATDAAENVAQSAKTIVGSTVVDTTAFVPTQTQFETSLTEATEGHYKGRIVIFVTGNLADEAKDITAYELVSGRGRVTVSTMTEAPSGNDGLIIC